MNEYSNSKHGSGRTKTQKKEREVANNPSQTVSTTRYKGNTYMTPPRTTPNGFSSAASPIVASWKGGRYNAHYHQKEGIFIFVFENMPRNSI